MERELLVDPDGSMAMPVEQVLQGVGGELGGDE